MANRYFSVLFFLTSSAAAQTAPPDTLQPAFDSAPSDSLAAAGYFRLQGQRQPAQPFQTFEAQLRTVAGVQVSPYSGAPGSMAAVRIRGAASLAGNPQPLYVVDGIPALQGPVGADNTGRQTGLSAIAPRDLNPLLSLPAENIDSVVVLKGPLETARYGAQGQNGVIEISTRKGRFDQGPRVRYSGAGGVQQAPYRYDLLSAREYAEVANEVAAAYGTAPRFTPAQVAALGAGTDWQRELLRTAAVQEHHLSLEGGTARTRGYVGADFLDQTGVLLNSSLRRYSLQANAEQLIGSRLRLALNVGLSQISARQPDPSVTLNLLATDPTKEARDAQGNLTGPNPNGGFSFFNPLRQALQVYEQPRQRRLLSHLALDYELTAGLHLSLDAGLEHNALHLTGYSAFFNSNFPGGLSLERDDSYRKLTLRPALRFARTLAERHRVSAGLEAWSQDYHIAREAHSFYGPQVSGLARSEETMQLLSYLAQAAYCFAGRYELQGSLRRDGSSVFASNQRWQYLPAAQLTWHIGQESFLHESHLLSQLDAWAGWGRTSNSGNMFDQSYLLLANPNGAYYYVPQAEITTQQAAGLRLGLAQNRLLVTGEAYQRLTEVTRPQFFSATPLPLGKVRNRGLELSATGLWTAGPVRGTTSLAAAINQNRAQDFGYFLLNSYQQRATDGQPLSSFYALRYQGVNPANGLPWYQTPDGSATTDANTADQRNLGSGVPRQLLSLTQQLSWHRLTVQAQLDGMFGYQIHNTSLLLLDAATGYDNSSGRVRDRWQPANPAGAGPGAGATNSLRLSSYTLQSGNHARLTTLTISFLVWEKAARSLTVWGGGNNLLVISRYRGFDPNVSSGGSDNKAAGIDAGAYPVARTVSVGIRATL